MIYRTKITFTSERSSSKCPNNRFRFGLGYSSFTSHVSSQFSSIKGKLLWQSLLSLWSFSGAQIINCHYCSPLCRCTLLLLFLLRREGILIAFSFRDVFSRAWKRVGLASYSSSNTARLNNRNKGNKARFLKYTKWLTHNHISTCLLYTSDAADE